MNFGELQTAIYQVCGYPPPVQPIVVNRVKNWINEAHRHCLRLPGFVELRQRSGLPFTSEAGRAIYAFPLALERVDAVVERTTTRRLRAISRDTFRSIDPAETSQGSPTAYAPEGWQPRFAVPHNSGIWFQSTDPADTTQVIRVQAIRANGAISGRIVLGLTGTTRRALHELGGPTDLIDIVSFDLSGMTAGDVSLYDAATAGRELSRIPAGLTFAQYWCLRLWPTPSSPITYYVDGQMEIPNLLYETDVPMLPPSYHDLLAAFGRMREYERTGDNRLGIAAAEWERGVAQLRAFVNYPDDYKPVAGSLSDQHGYTNLNGWFPADWSWP